MLSTLLALSLISSSALAAYVTNVHGFVYNPDGTCAKGHITVSWPAFVSASNDPVPAGSFTTTIGVRGSFSIDLISNTRATPSSTLYTVEYHLEDGRFGREHWLVPAKSQSTVAEVRTDQNTDQDIHVSELEMGSREVSIEAQSNTQEHAEIERYGLQGDTPRSQGQPESHLVVSQNGYLGDFYHSPARNPFSNQNDSWLQVCNYTSQPGWAGKVTGWTGTSNNCMNQYVFNTVPGIDLGNPAVGPGGWSTHKGISFNSTVNSPGISEIVGASQVKAGIGDTTGFYFYNYSYGGAIAASDEGNHLTAALGGEQNTVYTGNVTEGGNGATTLKVHCTADCQYPGDGRYLIDTQRPTAVGYVTGKTAPRGDLAPGTFTVDVNVEPSTAWGTLAANVVTPVAAQIGTGFTNMTFTVNVSHGSFVPGSLVCFGGQYHEQAIISSATGTNPVNLTVPLRHAHESGSWIMQGGPCGTFIEFNANSVTPGSQKIRYPVDILGATDSHTLVYRYFAYASGAYSSGYWPGNVSFVRLPATKLSNTNGTVTMSVIGGDPAQHPELYHANSIYISNPANPSFGGACFNTSITSSGQLSCTQRSSTAATSTAAEVSYGSSASGNTAFNLWPGAEVLDVLDYSTSPPAINGTFTLEPNSVLWTSGDAVENVHHYAAAIDAEHLFVSIYNPLKLNVGARILDLNGSGISGGNPAQPTFYAADRISNLESATNYAYHGGTVTPPGGIYLGGTSGNGLFDYGLAMQYAPDPPGSSAIFIGCPLSGCSDGAFYYSLFTLLGNGGSSAFTFTPATNILSLSGKGLDLKYEPLIAPTLQGETGGTSADLKFASIDTLGHSHEWTFRAPLAGGGFTLNLPQANGTLGLDTPFSPSGPSHSSGMVPDPGPNRGTTRFLREDGKWVSIPGFQERATAAPPLQADPLRTTSEKDAASFPTQPEFPSVVAHSSRRAQSTAINNFINYVPKNDGTFRLTVSIFIESPCDSGTISVNAYLSPLAGHKVGQTQNLSCTTPYGGTTSTVTAHCAAGVPISGAVDFNGVNAGALRYMADVILEQLQ
jgi:hypothetical protein